MSHTVITVTNSNAAEIMISDRPGSAVVGVTVLLGGVIKASVNLYPDEAHRVADALRVSAAQAIKASRQTTEPV